VPFAEIAIPLPVHDAFTYRVPGELSVQVGHAVKVPFGRKQLTGYVTSLTPALPADVTLKDVIQLVDPEPAFGPAQLEFFKWISDYYLAPLGEVIATALPVAYRARSKVVYRPLAAGVEAIATGSALGPDAELVLREVVARPGRGRRGLERVLFAEVAAEAVGRALGQLVAAGLVAAATIEAKAPGAHVATVELTGREKGSIDLGGARMRGVVARLVEMGGRADVDEIVEREGAGARDAIRRLEERGIVRRGEREDRRSTLGERTERDRARALNEPQQVARDAIVASQDDVFLLHGVTGSGKTEVYLQVAEAVLAAGRQVLVLVPEISLTPLLCGRFAARFGDAVAVLHSALTPTDRLREWRRIRAGEAKVAVGARSALFAPFSALGLVVVDEEHDDSYKQEDGVRYHARDLAVVLGRLTKCPVVLGSATPSLESYTNALDGRYTRLVLPTRATPRPVPRIELVDMRGRPTDKALSSELVHALGETLAEGGKAIVLYNRRGYAPTVECPGCGAHYACPSCGIELVLHQKQGRLLCHYCGFYREREDPCPACATPFAVLGFGTERLEEELQDAFPGTGVLRMDADTTASRGAHERILDAFRDTDARILVGTQLVAKGHDFPAVTLAAVVGVDHLLLLPDFRSAERTHALVTQLAGRAGRGTTPGRVLVQTRHADHFVFRELADASQDLSRDHFYEEESRGRRALLYPPFTRLALARVEGTDRARALGVARALTQELRERIGAERGRIDVLGPAPAPLGRLVGRWRFQLVVRGRDPLAFRRWLRGVRPVLVRAPHGGVRVTVDVDPRNLM
jgi:primosomal protein N' (replication factor Y)